MSSIFFHLCIKHSVFDPLVQFDFVVFSILVHVSKWIKKKKIENLNSKIYKPNKTNSNLMYSRPLKAAKCE